MTDEPATDGSDTLPEDSVVFLSGDLMFASKIKAAVEAAGLKFQFAGSLPDQQGIKWVIVDLATRASVVDGLMDQCQQICPAAKVLAYGPHVQVDKIQKAKQAGVPTVITRSQFHRSLPTLFDSDG